jgi:hypothetical protein
MNGAHDSACAETKKRRALHFVLYDFRQHADFLIMPTRYSKPALVAPETHWESA